MGLMMAHTSPTVAMAAAAFILTGAYFLAILKHVISFICACIPFLLH